MLSSIRGDNYTLNLTITKNDGTPYDITNWEVYFTVKANREDSDDDALISKKITSHMDPTHGITAITLGHNDTKDLADIYFYDIQVKRDDLTIATLMNDKIEFIEDVTERIS